MGGRRRSERVHSTLRRRANDAVVSELCPAMVRGYVYDVSPLAAATDTAIPALADAILPPTHPNPTAVPDGPI